MSSINEVLAGLEAISAWQERVYKDVHALGYGLNPMMAALLGMLTGIGGGMLRDVIISQVPTVLRSELYAVAALAGASAVVVGHVLNFPPTVMAIVGAVICFGFRLIAIWRGGVSQSLIYRTGLRLTRPTIEQS